MSYTPEQLLAATEQIIRDYDRWDYVYGAHYDSCLYKDERGAPLCLIGHVLARWGLLDEIDPELNGHPIYSIASPAHNYSVSALVDALLTETAEVASAIQNAQDADKTWGEALREGYTRLYQQGFDAE